MHRAEPAAGKLDDYFVIIKRRGSYRRPNRTRWTWQIQRRSMPLDVKFDDVKYVTPQEAKRAGQKALSELLHNLGHRI
jgi:hypothetical protein